MKVPSLIHRAVKLVAVCGLAAALTSTASAQEWARRMFDETTHDFGAVARGSTVEHRFRFKNLYADDLHVVAVRSSCGCTQPTVDVKTIGTHEYGEVIARFNTRSFLGQRSATLTVTFDQPRYAEVQLHVSGYIRSDIVLDPPGAAFGNVPQGAQRDLNIDVSYAGRGDWQVSRIESENPHLQAELIEGDRSAGRAKYEIHVTLADDAPAGYLRDEIRVYTNDSRAEYFPIAVEANVAPALSVTPSPLFLGRIAPGESVSKRVVVRGTEAFSIADVQCGNQAFHFKQADAAKKVHLVEVAFDAPEQAGRIEQSVRLVTSGGHQSELELIVIAEVVGQAD